ncbi:MAG: nucleotidyltransferase family protein [Chromatiaceae bacterium]|nr:nucleotidyltransferase family protein [Chromatiaceae bacterium]
MSIDFAFSPHALPRSVARKDIDACLVSFGYHFVPLESAPCVSEAVCVEEAMGRIDEAEHGTLMVLGAQGELVGMLANVDLRKYILRRGAMDAPVSQAMNDRPQVLTEQFSPQEFVACSDGGQRRVLPCVGGDGRPIGVVAMKRVGRELRLDNLVVIMVGGKGLRLRPLTAETPKPMLPIADKPLLEVIVRQLAAQGFHRFIFALHYKFEQIQAHFGDGSAFGVTIDYLLEQQPLGTAGALGLLRETLDQPFFVTNGDLLTKADFRKILDFHREEESDFTVGAVRYDISVPYGVLLQEDDHIKGIVEKPVYRHYVNAGIYLLNPALRQRIPKGQRTDMTDLMTTLLAEKKRLLTYPIIEYWLDIGRHPDLELARAEFDVHFGESC